LVIKAITILRVFQSKKILKKGINYFVKYLEMMKMKLCLKLQNGKER